MKSLIASSTSRQQQPRGFSLVELLMALAVISTLAAVAIFSLGDVVGAGKDAATLRNAQQFCQTYEAARAAGAEFHGAAASSILDELISGKKGRGQFAKSEFRLPLAEKEKREVLKLCDYDALTGGIALRK